MSPPIGGVAWWQNGIHTKPRPCNVNNFFAAKGDVELEFQVRRLDLHAFVLFLRESSTETTICERLANIMLSYSVTPITIVICLGANGIIVITC